MASPVRLPEANFDYGNHISLSWAFNKLSMLFLSQARLAHTRATQKDRQHPNHTLRGARASRAPTTTVPMGRALRARPIGTVVFPLVCGLDVGGLFVWHVCGLALPGSDDFRMILG